MQLNQDEFSEFLIYRFDIKKHTSGAKAPESQYKVARFSLLNFFPWNWDPCDRLPMGYNFVEDRSGNASWDKVFETYKGALEFILNTIKEERQTKAESKGILIDRIARDDMRAFMSDNARIKLDDCNDRIRGEK